MNKQELIEHINNTLFDNLKDTLFTEPTFSITENAKDNKLAITFETERVGVLVGGMLKKFEKVTIPQFVADWIEYCKENHLTITGAFEPVSEHGIGLAETFKGSAYKCTRWALDNQNLFARAWLDGYTVEKEKRYLVKMKGVSEHSNYLNYDSIDDEWYLTDYENGPAVSTYHTRKQLEEAGFGEVFNSPLFEVEEVE